MITVPQSVLYKKTPTCVPYTHVFLHVGTITKYSEVNTANREFKMYERKGIHIPFTSGEPITFIV